MQLLGFPLQLVGVLALPWAYITYVDESNSIVDDLGSAAVSCSSPVCLLHKQSTHVHLHKDACTMCDESKDWASPVPSISH